MEKYILQICEFYMIELECKEKIHKGGLNDNICRFA